MKIDLFVLGFNKFITTTKLCLDSLTNANIYCETYIYTLNVIDNASTDGSAEFLLNYLSHNESSKFTITLNTNNLGYGGGMNSAAINSQADWLVLVNSDIIFSTNALKALGHAMITAASDVALIHPITNNAGNAQGLYSTAKTPTGLFEEWQDLVRFPLATLTPQYRSDFSCVAIRRHVWQELKGLDPIYGRGYFEDFDFSVRAQALGYKSMICENSIVYHTGSASFSKDSEQSKLIKNNKNIFQKLHPSTLLLHQRVENYIVVEYYLNLLTTTLSEAQQYALFIRLQLRIKTAKHLLPKSFFKRLYWKYKINNVINQASVYFPEMKELRF